MIFFGQKWIFYKQLVKSKFVTDESHFSAISNMKKSSVGFPRITSRIPKEVAEKCCMKIVEVPEEERKVTGQHFKLVWFGREESESDLSNKSESSEWSDEDVQLPVESTEEPKNIDSKTEPQVDINEPLKKSPNKICTRSPNKRCTRSPKNKNRSKNRRSNNYNSPKKSFKTSTQGYNYGTVISSSIMEKRIYKNCNSNDSFGISSNFERSVQPISNSSNDIEPWETRPVLPNTIPNYQNPNYVICPYVSAVAHFGNLPSISRTSFGILGDSPYSHSAANFQPNSQNGNFMYGANYWNVGQYRQSANYQSRTQTYFQRRKVWNKYRKKFRARYKNFGEKTSEY